MLAGLAGAVAGQILLSQQGDPAPGWWWLAGGSLIWAGAVAASRRWVGLRWIADWPGTRPKSAGQWPDRWVVGGLLIAGGLGAVAAVQWIGAGFTTQSSSQAALLWLAGLAVALGSLIAAARSESRTGADARRGWPAAPFVLAGVVFLVALAIRLYQIDQVPFGVWFGEGETGLEGRRLLAGAVY